MSTIQIEALLSKLDQSCQVIYESALEHVVHLQQRCVELSHIVYALLKTTEEPLCAWYKTYNNYTLVMRELDKEVQRYPVYIDSTPTLSQDIIDATGEAWLFASLECHAVTVTPQILLYAILSNVITKQVCYRIAPHIKEFSLEALLNVCQSTVNDSPIVTVDTNNKDFTYLTEYAINLTEQAKVGKIDPVIGRDEEIQQMIDVLLRRRQNNPILIGEPGVGKTAVVEGLALRIADGHMPSSLLNAQIYTLDLALLQAGASIKGEFEKRLKAIIAEIQQSDENILLFIDEAHNLIGAGATAGMGDAANILKPALARGELRTIAATTWREYKKYFESDPALVRRFQVINIDEPSIEACIAMLRAMKQSLSDHHHIIIQDDAITSAVYLSDSYLSERKLPDKALSLLDTACARASSPRQGAVLKLINIQSERAILQNQIQNLLLEVPNFIISEKLAECESSMKRLHENEIELQKHVDIEKRLISELDELDEKLNQQATPECLKQKGELLQQLQDHQANTRYMYYAVDLLLIASVLSGWTDIPVETMLMERSEKIVSLADSLSKVVKGQDVAIKTIHETILSSTVWSDENEKPLGVFLLTGPSGVGKTETAYTLANILFGSTKRLTKINMSEYKEAHKVATLVGSPPGYVGYGEGGVLTEAVRRMPHQVILLDEMEKAHPSVQDMFYTVFDRGFMQDGEGRSIDFRQTIFIMTANTADEYIIKYAKAILTNDSTVMEGLTKLVQKDFKPAFLGRISLIPYVPLSKSTLKTLLIQELQKLKDKLKKCYTITLLYNEDILLHILDQVIDHPYGVRALHHILKQHIQPLITKKIVVDQNLPQDATLLLGVDDDDYILTIS